MLARAGFAVADVPEGHLCCGSAGTYNILQPELATKLRDRKIANIARLAPDVIAAGNIGCITQIASGTATPVVHPVELIDWATGGPVPAACGDGWRAGGAIIGAVTTADSRSNPRLNSCRIAAESRANVEKSLRRQREMPVSALKMCCVRQQRPTNFIESAISA